MQSNGFWRKLFLYFLPFGLAFTILTGSLLYVGESLPLHMVAQMQQADDLVLYRPQYGNRDPQFKMISANMRRAEVLALGSSRILQFRAGFMDRNPAAFYNAAGPGWQLPQVADLLYALAPEARPEVLLLAIDAPWFNDAYESHNIADDFTDLENIFLADRSFLQDVLAGHDFGRTGFDMSAYTRREEPGGSGGVALGLRAIRDGHGFRSDGSEQYGDFLVAHWLGQEHMRDLHMGWMRAGTDMYPFGDTISEPDFAEFAAMIDFAASNGITVIGFLPPYAPELWREMMANGKHTYHGVVRTRLKALFDSYGFPFFDFSDGGLVAAETEFFDGWHLSELGNLRMYLQMVDALPDLLGRYSDRKTLARIIAGATDTWAVFGMGNDIP